MHSLLEHPLLVSMIGAYVPPDSTRGNCALVLEYAERGCLYDILREPTYQEISWKKRMDMAIMVATSMEFLHTYGIVHRDLKSLNILVTKDMTLKLTDYGTSRLVSDHMTQNVGTVAWIAPEVLESQNYTEMADVYSFGSYSPGLRLALAHTLTMLQACFFTNWRHQRPLTAT